MFARRICLCSSQVRFTNNSRVAHASSATSLYQSNNNLIGSYSRHTYNNLTGARRYYSTEVDANLEDYKKTVYKAPPHTLVALFKKENEARGFSKPVHGNLVLSKLLASSRMRDMEQVFEIMKTNNSVNVATLNIMLNSKTDDLNACEEFFANFSKHGQKPNLVSYNILLGAIKNTRNAEACKNFLQRMKSEGFTPDVVSYNAVLTAIGNSKDLSACEEFLGTYKSANITPEVTTHNIVLQVVVNSKGVDAAKEYLTKMKSEGFPPNERSHNTILGGIKKSGDVSACLKYFDTMKSEGISPSIYSYNLVLQQVAKSGNISECENFLNKMKSEGIQPNNRSHNTVLLGIAQVNKEEAKNYAKKMKSEGFTVSYNTRKVLRSDGTAGDE